MATYEHGEAFCLMAYRADDGTEEEVIWNSRDGVTPFVIRLRSGKQAKHVEWHRDRCVPDHLPEPGSRMFVDLTREQSQTLALEHAREAFAGPRVSGMHPSQMWASPEAMAAEIAGEWRPGSPALVEVPAGGEG